MRNVTYYRQREAEEVAAAQCSVHPNARRVHLQLAEGYGVKVRSIEAAERRLAFQLVTAAA